MKKLNLGLSIAAGLLGGIFSHYVWTQPVEAQNQAPAPKELRAQSFVVVNDKGEIQAVLTFGKPKDDSKGREIFTAGGDQLRPLSSSLR